MGGSEGERMGLLGSGGRGEREVCTTRGKERGVVGMSHSAHILHSVVMDVAKVGGKKSISINKKYNVFPDLV